MNIYIILSYPNDHGLCYAAFGQLKKGFEDAGHAVRTTDLYREQFDPVLIFNQEKRLRDMQFDEETAVYRENIAWADKLVFVFPIWWSGMPAMMKGFIDRVFASGFAYNFHGWKKLFPIGHLKGKTAWLVNTQDTPWIVARFFRADFGRVFQKQVLPIFGIRHAKHDVIAGVRFSNQKKREKWLAKLYQRAKRT